MLHTARRHDAEVVTRQQQEALFPLLNSSSLSSSHLLAGLSMVISLSIRHLNINKDRS